MVDLMSRIEQHVRVEENEIQPPRAQDNNAVPQKKQPQSNHPRETCQAKQPKPVRKESYEAVNTTFKEPIFRILPQIKDKPYFICPPKMGGDPVIRESRPYRIYHKERGHLIENCKAYKGFLEDLVHKGHLRQFVDESKVKPQQENSDAPKDPIGIIEVIHSHTKTTDLRSETQTTAHMQVQLSGEAQPVPKHLRKVVTEEITFTNQDLEGVQLTHSNALVVTMRVGNFNIKRILIDPRSSAEIKYEPLFRGLGLGESDSDWRADPLHGFSGESLMLAGQVTIKVHARIVSSPMEFWVLNAYSPYNAILG